MIIFNRVILRCILIRFSSYAARLQHLQVQQGEGDRGHAETWNTSENW